MTETQTTAPSILDQMKDLRPDDRVIYYNICCEKIDERTPASEGEKVSPQDLLDISEELSVKESRELYAAIATTLEAYDSELDDVDYGAVLKGALSLGSEQAKNVVMRVASNERVATAVAAVETTVGKSLDGVKKEAADAANTTRRGFSILGAEVILGATKWLDENGGGIREGFKARAAKAMEGVTTEMKRLEQEDAERAAQAEAEEKAAKKGERKSGGWGIFGRNK